MKVYVLEVGNTGSYGSNIVMGVFKTPKKARKWLKHRGTETGKWSKHPDDEDCRFYCFDDGTIYHLTEHEVDVS